MSDSRLADASGGEHQALIDAFCPVAFRDPLANSVTRGDSADDASRDSTDDVQRDSTEPASQPKADEPPKAAWITRALSDPEVTEAVSTLKGLAGSIRFELTTSKSVRINPTTFRVELTDNIDAGRQEAVIDLLDDHQEATKRIIDALMRHAPNIRKRDRPALRKPFDRWWAKEALGATP